MAFELVESFETTGGASSITISGIPTDARHLFLEMQLRSNQNTSQNECYMTFNSSAQSYYQRRLNVTSSTSVNYYSDTNTSNLNIRQIGSTYSGEFTQSTMYIYDYGTSKYKTYEFWHSEMYAGSTGQLRIGSGTWFETAPITSITLTDPSSTFASGVSINLYKIY
jgi:hypothetical protein